MVSCEWRAVQVRDLQDLQYHHPAAAAAIFALWPVRAGAEISNGSTPMSLDCCLSGSSAMGLGHVCWSSPLGRRFAVHFGVHPLFVV